jgi:ABC-2 type transport system ATP-binding protein
VSKDGSAGGYPAIEARGLVKVYGETRALDGVDLTVRRSQVFGFPGPNGASKTTMIRILARLARPDGGTTRGLGFDVASEADAIRARVAVTGQFASLDDDLTGYENLIVFGRLRGLSRAASKQRADELLAAFDLVRAASRPVDGYSGGMRRRPDIGASLIVTPDLLFLDEPSTGIDPGNRSQVGTAQPRNQTPDGMKETEQWLSPCPCPCPAIQTLATGSCGLTMVTCTSWRTAGPAHRPCC